MKKERKITIALLVIYLLILSWIILFKLQFSFFIDIIMDYLI